MTRVLLEWPNISLHLAGLTVHLEVGWRAKIRRHAPAWHVAVFAALLAQLPSSPPLVLPHPLPHEALRKFTSFAGNQPSQSENRFSFCQPFTAADFPDRVPVPFIACGIALACTPESRHSVCSQNNASFFPSLFPWVIHSPVVLEPVLLQRIPQSWWGCCHSLPACCAQPATAGKPGPSDVILFRSYTTIQMPDIVSAPVVCYPVYSSLIFCF